LTSSCPNLPCQTIGDPMIFPNIHLSSPANSPNMTSMSGVQPQYSAMQKRIYCLAPPLVDFHQIIIRIILKIRRPIVRIDRLLACCNSARMQHCGHLFQSLAQAHPGPACTRLLPPWLACPASFSCMPATSSFSFLGCLLAALYNSLFAGHNTYSSFILYTQQR
jgi:hypothetical protein